MRQTKAHHPRCFAFDHFTIKSVVTVSNAQWPLQYFFWRHSQCPNFIQNSLLEIPLSLLSICTFILEIEGHLPYQNADFPRLVNAQCPGWKTWSVLLQEMIKGITQLQIESTISHWQDIFSSYHLIHLESHLENPDSGNSDFSKVTPEVQQLS